MAVDQRPYRAEGVYVFRQMNSIFSAVAKAESFRLAKRIAAALNLYRPKVRRRKSAEKASNSAASSR